MMGHNELEFVEWLRGRQKRHPTVALGIGDDMAALAPQNGLLLLSCDMLLDGVHFDSTKHSLEQIGRKAIGCSLSDCAAMAVRPLAATVALALPKAMSLEQAQELYQGMMVMAEELEMAIVGGDTTSWNHPLAIDVAITATTFDGIDPVTRSGAKIGDTLYVTGALGGSLLGRHLRFVPRIHEAQKIAGALGGALHAMMDISDGLSLDLWRMCRASKVGAILDEALLTQVIHDDARRAASADGRSPLDHALSDGEDFELLIAAARDSSSAGLPLLPIGSVVESGLSLRRLDGRVEVLEPKGFVH